MSTTTAEPTHLVDPRPLHVRLKHKIQDPELKTDVLATTVGLGGAAAYGGSMYIGYVVGIAFLETLSIPAWILTLTYWAGAAAVFASLVGGFWTGWNFIKQRSA